MKHTIRFGNTTLDSKLTEAGALRYGNKHMPASLKRVGFETILYHATVDINGWQGLRINYGKVC